MEDGRQKPEDPKIPPDHIRRALREFFLRDDGSTTWPSKTRHARGRARPSFHADVFGRLWFGLPILPHITHCVFCPTLCLHPALEAQWLREKDLTDLAG